MCSVQRIIGTRNSNKHATDAVVHDPVKPVFILDCASFYKSFPCLNDPLPLLWGQAQVNHFLNWAVGSKLWLRYIKDFDKAYSSVARQSVQRNFNMGVHTTSARFSTVWNGNRIEALPDTDISQDCTLRLFYLLCPTLVHLERISCSFGRALGSIGGLLTGTPLQSCKDRVNHASNENQECADGLDCAGVFRLNQEIPNVPERFNWVWPVAGFIGVLLALSGFVLALLSWFSLKWRVAVSG